MRVVEVKYGEITPIWQKCFDDGYPYTCECGEDYSTQIGAEHCKKCRVYLDHIPSKVWRIIK